MPAATPVFTAIVGPVAQQARLGGYDAVRSLTPIQANKDEPDLGPIMEFLVGCNTIPYQHPSAPQKLGHGAAPGRFPPIVSHNPNNLGRKGYAGGLNQPCEPLEPPHPTMRGSSYVTKNRVVFPREVSFDYFPPETAPTRFSPFLLGAPMVGAPQDGRHVGAVLEGTATTEDMQSDLNRSVLNMTTRNMINPTLIDPNLIDPVLAAADDVVVLLIHNNTLARSDTAPADNAQVSTTLLAVDDRAHEPTEGDLFPAVAEPQATTAPPSDRDDPDTLTAEDHMRKAEEKYALFVPALTALSKRSTNTMQQAREVLEYADSDDAVEAKLIENIRSFQRVKNDMEKQRAVAFKHEDDRMSEIENALLKKLQSFRESNRVQIKAEVKGNKRKNDDSAEDDEQEQINKRPRIV